jgi:hypothetical protein
VQGDTKAEAFQDGAVDAQPFFTQSDRGVQNDWIGLEQCAQGTALVQVDNNISERLDAASHGAEDQDGLSVIDKPPGGREAEFALVVGK